MNIFTTIKTLLAVSMMLSTSLWGADIKTKSDLKEGPIRILVITGGHGFEAKPFYALFNNIEDVEMTKIAYPQAAELFKPELAQKIDVIVFYDMWAKGMTSVQQQGLVDLLESGIGVVALHHTLAAHPNWPEYEKIIGGKYYMAEHKADGKKLPASGYLHGQEVDVKVADADHPITRGLKDFTIHDETYCRYDTDPKARVLLKTGNSTSDPELAWVTQYGNSRVFYLQLGHDHHAYTNPSYRTLVARGIRWAAGRVADPKAAPAKLFNGKDLTGWKSEGGSRWHVADGLLVGQQGPNNAPGDLLTEASYDDFEVKVTFRAVWPLNSGVWYRYESASKAYQADILEYKNPFALTGSLYCTGKMFIATNEDAKLIDREGWNTLIIRAVGDRQMVFINGTKVADIRDDTSARGRIGFQIHAGAQFGKMRIIIKEATIRPV